MTVPLEVLEQLMVDVVCQDRAVHEYDMLSRVMSYLPKSCDRVSPSERDDAIVRAFASSSHVGPWSTAATARGGRDAVIRLCTENPRHDMTRLNTSSCAILWQEPKLAHRDPAAH